MTGKTPVLAGMDSHESYIELYGFHRFGFDGEPVAIEVDVRPGGLPGIDLVGLPDSAVREARDRVRAGVRKAGYPIPRGRILLNLAPAGIKKEGAGFDLPIAFALVGASLGWFSDNPGRSLTIMALGEVLLSGAVKSVRGVLSAAATAHDNGIDYLIVPRQNADEARALGMRNVIAIEHIRQGVECVESLRSGNGPPASCGIEQGCPPGPGILTREPDFADMRGQAFLKRGLEIAAAGGHHSLVFGPPGTGKTMAALRLASILPDLNSKEAIEVTKIHSIAGLLPSSLRLITRPQARSPHHSSSLQGILGGGPALVPGEISLAHRGVLVLDEAPEFGRNILQNLREPIERGEVRIARAGRSAWFPSRFQLVMTANPCPCGNLGKKSGVCVCSREEVARYWRRIGGALLDRIDIRIPVDSGEDIVTKGSGETSAEIRERVESAAAFRLETRAQKVRNCELAVSDLPQAVQPGPGCSELLSAVCEKLDLSSRALHSVLRVSRTIADLKEEPVVGAESLKEAILYRRYGDSNFLWNNL